MQIHNIDNTQKVSMARINPEKHFKKVYKYISLIVLISKNNFGS